MKVIHRRISRHASYPRLVCFSDLRLIGLIDIQIINDCIPPEVLKFVSNAPDTPKHGHKSLIMNLVCGPSVNQTIAHHSLLQRWVQRLSSRVYFMNNSYAECSHCADAVLSLSNNATIFGEVAAPLVDFAARWAQSPSDYDFIVSATLNTEWASKHHPVLSRADHSHFVYTQYRRWEPIYIPSRSRTVI